MGGNSSIPLADIPANQSIVCFITKDVSLAGNIQSTVNGLTGAKEWLITQNKNVGEIAIAPMGSYYIYYGVVKKHDYNKAVTADVRTVLDAIVAHADPNGVGTVNVLSPCYYEIENDDLQVECDAAANGTSVTFVIHAS